MNRSKTDRQSNTFSLTKRLKLVTLLTSATNIGGLMTKITIAETKSPIHPNLSSAYLGDQMNQLAHALSQTTPTQDKPMPIDMTFQQFLWCFPTESKALAYIESMLADGRIEVIERTLPYYTWTGERFVAYADHQQQTHSFEMRIERYYYDGDSSVDAIVTFDRTDGGCEWFFDNLYSTLDGIIEESELHWEDTPQAHRMREIGALQLQRDAYHRRINNIRLYLIESGAEMLPATFEQNCKDMADLLNKQKHAHHRIIELTH